MQKEISRISPLRTGIIYAVLIAVIYLVVGVLSLAFGGLFMGGMPPLEGIEGLEGFESQAGPGAMAAGGVMAVLFGAVFGVIFGFIGGVLMAVLYNFVASITGGIIVTFRDP